MRVAVRSIAVALVLAVAVPLAPSLDAAEGWSAVGIQVREGRRPAPGIEVRLRAETSGLADAGALASGVTDAQGRAVLYVQPGIWRLELATGESVDYFVMVRVAPGRRAEELGSPARDVDAPDLRWRYFMVDDPPPVADWQPVPPTAPAEAAPADPEPATPPVPAPTEEREVPREQAPVGPEPIAAAEEEAPAEPDSVVPTPVEAEPSTVDEEPRPSTEPFAPPAEPDSEVPVPVDAEPPPSADPAPPPAPPAVVPSPAEPDSVVPPPAAPPVDPTPPDAPPSAAPPVDPPSDESTPSDSSPFGSLPPQPSPFDPPPPSEGPEAAEEEVAESAPDPELPVEAPVTPPPDEAASEAPGVTERAAEPVPAEPVPVEEPAAVAPTPPERPVEVPPEPPFEEEEAAPTPLPAPSPPAEEVPVPLPAPVRPAPEPPAPSEPELPAAPPRFSASGPGDCPDCRDDEAVVVVERTVRPGGGVCGPEIAAAALDAARGLAGGASGPRALDGAAVVRWTGGDGCQLLGVVLPAGTTYRGYRYEVEGGDAAGRCYAGSDCPVPGAVWPERPTIRPLDGGGTMVYGLFRNTSADRARRARLAVYYLP